MDHNQFPVAQLYATPSRLSASRPQLPARDECDCADRPRRRRAHRRYQGSARVLQNRGGAYASPGWSPLRLVKRRLAAAVAGRCVPGSAMPAQLTSGPGKRSRAQLAGRRLETIVCCRHIRPATGDRIVATGPSRARPGPSGSSGCAWERELPTLSSLLGLAVRVRILGATRRPATALGRRVARSVRPDAAPATSGVARRRCGGVGDVLWVARPRGSGGSVAVVVVGWLEVVLVEVAGDRGAELDALEVRGAEVDAGPDASVDVFLQRV